MAIKLSLVAAAATFAVAATVNAVDNAVEPTIVASDIVLRKINYNPPAILNVGWFTELRMGIDVDWIGKMVILKSPVVRLEAIGRIARSRSVTENSQGHRWRVRRQTYPCPRIGNPTGRSEGIVSGPGKVPLTGVWGIQFESFDHKRHQRLPTVKAQIASQGA